MKHNSRRGDPVGVLARFVVGCGLAGFVAGLVSWFGVRSQMAGERIVVPEKADRLAGHVVKGPFTALAEANTIKRAALEATGGRTYSELGSSDDATETAREASLLRASLFTSVLAFGVAAVLVVSGLVLVAVGSALTRLSERSPGGR